jgi:hypothetical protein
MSAKFPVTTIVSAFKLVITKLRSTSVLLFLSEFGKRIPHNNSSLRTEYFVIADLCSVSDK